MSNFYMNNMKKSNLFFRYLQKNVAVLPSPLGHAPAGCYSQLIIYFLPCVEASRPHYLRESYPESRQPNIMRNARPFLIPTSFKCFHLCGVSWPPLQFLWRTRLPLPVTFGVPQGRVLEKLLFIIYMNIL